MKMKLRALRQKYGELCDRQQAIINKAVEESRALTGEEKTELETLQTEIDGLNNTIQQAERLEARNADLNQREGEGELWRPNNFVPGAPSMNNRQQDDGGFESLGELLLAVRFGDKKGRLVNLATSDAGILIPPAFSENILTLDGEAELVMPRAQLIPVGDPPDGEFTVPYFDQGANGANGGVSLTWTAEAQAINEVNKPGIKDLTLKPHEASGLATINNKTLQNWRSSGAFIQSLMRQAWIDGRDLKFLKGTGAGAPLGVLKAPGAIKIARATANTVKVEDTANMLGRLLPQAMAKAVWVASITLLPTIATMKDDAGNLVYMPGNITQGIPATLWGLPIKFTGKSPVKGSEGDLMLVDFSFYLIKPGSGPFVALSEHVKFTNNQTVFRIVANIDGQPWVKDALKLEDGVTTVSPYVILK